MPRHAAPSPAPIHLAFLPVLATLGASVHALEPAPIRIGFIDLVPTLETDVRHTDNMFLASDNAQESAFVLVRPMLTATVTDGRNRYSTTLELQNGNYSATRVDDYNDWKLGAATHLELGLRNLVDLEAEYFNTHEVRGTGFSQGSFFTPIPDQFDATTLTARYQFGTNESKGRIVLDATSYRKDYTNNPLTTLPRNRDDMSLGGTFYLGMLPRTDILLQYRHKDVDYRFDPPGVDGTEDSLDSVEAYAYIGATWEATAKTSGTLKAGYGTKDFIDPDRPDTRGPSWEAVLRWEPLSYSIVNLTTGRIFGEQNGIGSGVDSRSYSLSWEHQWSTRLRSAIAGSHSDDEYLNSLRQDRVRDLSARVDYAFDTWLDLFISVGQDSRSSVLDAFDYDQNTLRIGFAASL